MSERVAGADALPALEFDPDKGAYLASFGPKGTGKSELSKRLFLAYPYDGLLIDHTGDADPESRFTTPFPASAIAKREWPEPPEGQRFARYRYVPNYLDDDWLDRTDEVIGIAYDRTHVCIWLDEMNDALPAGATPKFTRLVLRMGRHKQLSVLMPGPRPAGIDPLGLSQPDVTTIHGPLHELDVKRLAQQWHCSTQELFALIDALGPYEFLAYFKETRELWTFEPLPAVKERRAEQLA